MRAEMLCSCSGLAGTQQSAFLPFPCRTPGNGEAFVGGEGIKPTRLSQIREGLPQVPGHSQPAGRRCERGHGIRQPC